MREVELFLPRFTFRSDLRLPPALQALGMKAAFERTADFSGMTGGKDLVLADVIHQTYVDVSERGGRKPPPPAARTQLLTARQGQPAKPPVVIFRADHPFLVCIRHDSSRVVLFQGQVTKLKP